MTEEEILKLYAVHNTDELIEFLHKTGRNYSVKVHRTINRKSKLSTFKRHSNRCLLFPKKYPGRNTQDSLSSSENDDEGIAPSNIDDEKKASQNQEKEKEKDKVAPGVDPENPDIINLNSNVYLELIYITEEDYSDLEGETSHRRPFFVVPDPDLSDEIGKDSEATWLELFGDVFYVGFLATFTHEHHIVDSHELGVYAAWFVVVWWTWCAGALYSSRYDRSDVVHHIYKIIELCGLVGMAGASSDFWDHPRGFIIGYMGMSISWNQLFCKDIPTLTVIIPSDEGCVAHSIFCFALHRRYCWFIFSSTSGSVRCCQQYLAYPVGCLLALSRQPRCQILALVHFYRSRGYCTDNIDRQQGSFFGSQSLG